MKMSMLARSYRLWVLALFLTTTLSAQAPAARRVTFWLTAGYGRGWAQGLSGIEEAGNLAGSVRWGSLLLSGRVAAVSSSIFDTAIDVGLLAGVATDPGPKWRAGVAAGLGLVEAPDGRQTLGVPLEAQLFTRLSRFLGIGVYVFSDINTVASFTGASLALQVGWLP